MLLLIKTPMQPEAQSGWRLRWIRGDTFVKNVGVGVLMNRNSHLRCFISLAVIPIKKIQLLRNEFMEAITRQI